MGARVLSLDVLGLTGDPGREWHPRHGAAYSVNGDLLDLDDDQVDAHQAKPEAVGAEGVVAAEDSQLTPGDVV